MFGLRINIWACKSRVWSNKNNILYFALLYLLHQNDRNENNWYEYTFIYVHWVAKEGSLRDQDEKKDKASIDIKLNHCQLIF